MIFIWKAVESFIGQAAKHAIVNWPIQSEINVFKFNPSLQDYRCEFLIILWQFLKQFQEMPSRKLKLTWKMHVFHHLLMLRWLVCSFRSISFNLLLFLVPRLICIVILLISSFVSTVWLSFFFSSGPFINILNTVLLPCFIVDLFLLLIVIIAIPAIPLSNTSYKTVELNSRKWRIESVADKRHPLSVDLIYPR